MKDTIGAPGRIMVAVLALLAICFALTPTLPAAEIGAKAPDFRLLDTSGISHSLSGYAGKVVVLVFWAFKCPVALGFDARLAALQGKHASAGVIVLGVDSNSNESPQEVRLNVENLKLPFPVLLDEDGSLADKMGATKTPAFYLIDGGGILRYKGAFDGGKRPGESGRAPLLDQALEELLAGRNVTVPETPLSGCVIRRRT